MYRVTGDLPKAEMYGLVSQARRSAVSICSNIAEGAGRNTNGEFNQFLGIATGSSFELETQMIIARNLEFINQNEFEISEKKITEVQKMLHGFKKHIKSNK